MAMQQLDTQKQESPADGEDELWKKFIQQRDDAARHALINHYLPLARKISAILFSRRPGNDLEFADYMQCAVLGLIEAVDKYDPTKNASFPTYASYRIRGSILNGIEKTNERTAQHNFRKRVRRERLESLAGTISNKSNSDLFIEMVDVAVGLALGYMLEDSGMYHHDDNVTHQQDPYSCLEMSRIRERFQMVVEALPEKEQLVIKYHYYQNMSFTVVADVLGLTKGRVSQIHSRALILLREAYGSLNQFDVKY